MHSFLINIVYCDFLKKIFNGFMKVTEEVNKVPKDRNHI